MILFILSCHYLQDGSEIKQQYRRDSQDPKYKKEDGQASVFYNHNGFFHVYCAYGYSDNHTAISPRILFTGSQRRKERHPEQP